MPSTFFSEQVSAGPRDSRARLVPRHFHPAFTFAPTILKLSWIPRWLRLQPEQAPLAASWLRTHQVQIFKTIFSSLSEKGTARDEPCPSLWVLDAGFPHSLVALQFAETGPPPPWHTASDGDSGGCLCRSHPWDNSSSRDRLSQAMERPQAQGSSELLSRQITCSPSLNSIFTSMCVGDVASPSPGPLFICFLSLENHVEVSGPNAIFKNFFSERLFFFYFIPSPALKQYDIKSVYSKSIVQKEILFFFQVAV